MRFLVFGRNIIVICLFLLLVNIVSAAIINEIFYNPHGSDNNKEFVEIFTNQDLTGWIIADNKSNDTLERLFSFDSNYSLIVEQDFNYTGINASIYSVGATIGDNLNNGGDSLFLFDNENLLIDSVNYSDIADDGFTIERINNVWYESCKLGGSPGEMNNISCDEVVVLGRDLKIEVYLDDFLNLGQDYDKLFKITNVNKDLGKVYDVLVEYNITSDSDLIKQDFFIKPKINSYSSSSTGSFSPVNEGNYTVCGKIVNSSINDSNSVNDYDCKVVEVIDTSSIPCSVSINVTADKLLYNEGETMKFKIDLNNKSFPFSIEYWVEDLFDEIKKSKYVTSNTNKKSWTPSLDERDKAFLLNARLVNVLCNDTNVSDNHDETLVVFRNPDFSIAMASEESLSSESHIFVETISLGSDNKTEFGKTVLGKVRIYKGDTGRYSVKFYVKDSDGNKVSSQTSTTSLYSKFTEYVMKIPVQLKPNCNSKYDDGEYIFVVEGLNSSDEMSFKVEGKTASLCDGDCDSDCNEKKTKKKLEYSIDSIPDYVNILDKFDVSVKIENNYGDDYDFEIVGYLYRGSKHYSEKIVKHINVPHKGVAIVNFRNKIGKIDPGEYKYKVKIKREGLKTYKHLNSDVTVEGPDAEIKSFYTKAKEPKDQIKLYANVEGVDFKTVLETFYTTIETNLTGDLIFPVKIFEGRNVFFLKLVDNDGSIIDVRQLVVDVGETELESYEEKIDLYSEDFLLSNDFELESTREEIVYLSSSEKAKNLIPYLIIALTIIVCIVIVLKKD